MSSVLRHPSSGHQSREHLARLARRQAYSSDDRRLRGFLLPRENAGRINTHYVLLTRSHENPSMQHCRWLSHRRGKKAMMTMLWNHHAGSFSAGKIDERVKSTSAAAAATRVDNMLPRNTLSVALVRCMISTGNPVRRACQGTGEGGPLTPSSQRSFLRLRTMMWCG